MARETHLVPHGHTRRCPCGRGVPRIGSAALRHRCRFAAVRRRRLGDMSCRPRTLHTGVLRRHPPAQHSQHRCTWRPCHGICCLVPRKLSIVRLSPSDSRGGGGLRKPQLPRYRVLAAGLGHSHCGVGLRRKRRWCSRLWGRRGCGWLRNWCGAPGRYRRACDGVRADWCDPAGREDGGFRGRVAARCERMLQGCACRGLGGRRGGGLSSGWGGGPHRWWGRWQHVTNRRQQRQRRGVGRGGGSQSRWGCGGNGCRRWPESVKEVNRR